MFWLVTRALNSPRLWTVSGQRKFKLDFYGGPLSSLIWLIVNSRTLICINSAPTNHLDILKTFCEAKVVLHLSQSSTIFLDMKSEKELTKGAGESTDQPNENSVLSGTAKGDSGWVRRRSSFCQLLWGLKVLIRVQGLVYENLWKNQCLVYLFTSVLKVSLCLMSDLKIKEGCQS